MPWSTCPATGPTIFYWSPHCIRTFFWVSCVPCSEKKSWSQGFLTSHSQPSPFPLFWEPQFGLIVYFSITTLDSQILKSMETKQDATENWNFILGLLSLSERFETLRGWQWYKAISVLYRRLAERPTCLWENKTSHFPISTADQKTVKSQPELKQKSLM